MLSKDCNMKEGYCKTVFTLHNLFKRVSARTVGQIMIFLDKNRSMHKMVQNVEKLETDKEKRP